MSAPMHDGEYITASGQTCPFCRRTGTLEGASAPDFDGPEVTMKIECSACGATFFDLYRLAGYIFDR